MRTASFEYIKGAAQTNTPWFRPKPKLLNAWKEDFFKIPAVDKYKFWICGGALEEWETWDTDILITGAVKSYKELETIMVSATQAGFRHRQLIDINWNDYYEKYIDRGTCTRRGICCEHYYKHGWCEIEHCITRATDIETIVIAREITKNGKTLSRPHNSAIQLSDSLWRLSVTTPSKKQIKRIKEGITYKRQPILLTADLDFNEIIHSTDKRR